jgi:flagellar assembly protein FliH
MTKPTKFTFSNVFDIRDSVGKRGVAAAEARPRHYDEDALAAAHAQGRAEGAQDAYSEIEARIAAALEETSNKIQSLLERQAQMTGRMKRDSAVLAEAISKHLAPALLREKPLGEFEALVEACFAELHDEPRIVIKVAPSLAAAMAEKVSALASRLKPGHDVSVAGDPALAEFDCRVEWSDGGIERDYDRLESVISEAVQRFVGQWTDGAVAQVQGEIETEPWRAE